MATTLKITLSADSRNFEAELGRARAGLQAFAASAKGVAGQSADGVGRLGGSVLEAARCMFIGVTAANLFQQALDRAKQVIADVVQSTLALDRAQRTLQYATGDGAQAMGYVRKVAMELGLDLTTTAESYGKLAAASRGTSLQGKATQDVFKAVASASAVMGLTADQTSGAILALGQMISKGKVQAEELRGQLGERIPGAFQIAARAMGVTTAQLDKLLVEGKVIADDFLPKFAAELTRSLGDAPREASNSLQASLNRVKTAWTEFLVAVGKSGVIEMAASSARNMAAVLNAMASGGGLRALADLLGNVVVQMAAVGAAIRILVPLLATQLAPAFRSAAIAMAMMTSGAPGLLVGLQQMAVGLGTLATSALGATLLIVGVAYGMQRWAQSYQRAAADKAEADARMRGEATETTRAFVDQHNRAERLEAMLRTATKGSKDHAAAGKELTGIVRQLVSTYPDFLAYLKKEGDSYTGVAESMERYSKAKLKQLKIQLEHEQRGEVDSRNNKTDITLGSYQSKWLGTWGRAALNFGEWALVGKGIAADAEREEAAHRKSSEEIRKQIALLETWESGTPKPATAATSGKQKDVVTDLEHQARLRKWEAEAAARVTLEDERQAELLKIKADEEGDLARIAEERAKGKLTESQYLQERVALLNSHNQQKLNTIQKYDQKREEMEGDLQRRLTAQEEGGLAKRFAAIEKESAEIRKINEKLRLEGKSALFSEEQILSAETARKVSARAEQVQQDLSKLKKELADLAQTKGGALSTQEMADAMARFAGTSSTAADAVAKLRAEMHLGEGGWAGMLAGIKGFIAQSQNQFEVWKNATTSILGGLQNNFAQFFESIFQKGMTGAQKWDALWKGIVKTILGALSQMAAQWLVAAIANKIFGKSMAQTEAAKGVASQHAAAAGIFAAHSWIPFAGPGIAAGLISVMNGVLGANLASATAMSSKATAMAVGGRIDKPTLALMGEAGPELVAPERDFKDWARGMVSMGANLQGNVEARLSSARDYDLYGSGVAAAASRALHSEEGGRRSAGGPDLRGAVIFTSNSAEMARFLRAGLDTHGRLFG